MSYTETKNFNIIERGDYLEVQIDCENSSANAFNRKVLEELNSILDSIPENVKAVAFTSAKTTFVVGADVNEIYELAKTEDIEKLASFIRYGQETFNKIEDAPYATVALLNGTAMGGGLEIALACDYRIAGNDPNIKLALPETKLGILPAWGGTTRLPRLIGADNAIDLICSAKTVNVKQALKLHLLDGVINSNDFKMVNIVDQCLESLDFSQATIEKIRSKKKSRLKLNMIESMMVFKGAEGLVSKAAGPHYPAPLEALNTIKESKKLDRDDALELEANAAVKLGQLPVTFNLIEIFLKDQFIKAKNKKLSKDASIPEIVGVYGAGTMGGDIAYVTANNNILTYLNDAKEGAAEKAKGKAKDYLMDKVGKNYITIEEMTSVLNSMVVNESGGPKDIAVEAIYENFDAKVELIKSIENSRIIVSNTSTISITALSEATGKEVCGMHFFNPVKKMPLVEVIRGKNTSDETVAEVVAFALKLGKTPIVVNDCPGFLVNRLLFPYLLTFDKIVKKVNYFEQIDKVMKNWGWPMGPATLCDLVGIDIAYHGGKIMADAYGWEFDPDGPISTLFKSGELGQKTGSGFYNWKEKRGKKVVNGVNYSGNTTTETISEEEIVSKLMEPMYKEAQKILEEGVVDSWDEIDLAMILGAGYPPFMGGLSKLNEGK